jgi:hypothetical protein
MGGPLTWGVELGANSSLVKTSLVQNVAKSLGLGHEGRNIDRGCLRMGC